LWISTIVILLLGVLSPANAQTPTTTVWTREFAVKVICGPTTSATPPVAPGRYFTAINMHNPGRTTAAFQLKVAVSSMPHAELELVPGPVTKFVSGDLKPDQAIEIDCQHAVALAKTVVTNTGFLKGFLVLQSTAELDVVAVYTASGPTARVQSMTLERVPPRPMTSR
jgi:hypothetical protein